MVSIMPFWTCGLMITLVPTATNSVWPSGLAAAAARRPIEPAAPPLLSMMICWPMTGVMTLRQLAGIDVRAAARGIADDEGHRAGRPGRLRAQRSDGRRRAPASPGRGRGGG